MSRPSFAAGTIRLGAALALASAVAGAQSFPTDDAVIRRIWQLGMDSSQAYSLAQTLADSIGPRLTGSPGLRSANDWLVATYGRWGITARNEQYGTWRGWRRGVTHADLVAPRVRTLEATMLAWSPGTRGPVEGRVVALPDLADSAAFARWLPEARGTFVLVSFPQPSCRPDSSFRQFATPESWERHVRSRSADSAAWEERVRRTGYTARTLPVALERAGAAGLLTSLWSRGWGVDKVFQARTERVPSLDVMCEDYGLLYRLASRNQGPRLRVDAQSQALGDVPVFNTIAEIRGSEKPDEYVMLSAHLDSWDAASGATDNATGTVTMLEAMRILRQAYPRPKRTILVGHWSGEEQGLNGSRAFAADHAEIVKGLQALFNQDNGTGRVTNISAQGLVGAGEFLARWMGRI
ncbi:MAG: M20/M25/M40 family metallo-hydrolase, partial [Gemmatimonadaceae bacterium]